MFSRLAFFLVVAFCVALVFLYFRSFSLLLGFSESNILFLSFFSAFHFSFLSFPPLFLTTHISLTPSLKCHTTLRIKSQSSQCDLCCSVRRYKMRFIPLAKWLITKVRNGSAVHLLYFCMQGISGEKPWTNCWHTQNNNLKRKS